jgi:hypothetical protein
VLVSAIRHNRDGPSSPNNRPSQEPKGLASLNAPGAFLSWPPVFLCPGENSLRLTLLAPGFCPDGPLQFDQVRLCIFWSPSRCAAWKQLGANDQQTPGTGHDGLQGAGSAHLGQPLSVLDREADFRGGWPSTSPPSPGLPPPSNACATFARSGRFFEADATLLSAVCPAMGTCRRSEVGPRPGDPAPF